VERVHIPRPKDGDTHSKFGFVHFRERAGAVRAVEDDDKPQLEGTSLTVGMAAVVVLGRQGWVSGAGGGVRNDDKQQLEGSSLTVRGRIVAA
jgi:hypothetical protein